MLRFALVCLSVAAAKASQQESASVRVLDATGVLSNAGLLQVRTEEHWGSVCGLNPAAADVVCRTMGYTYGSLASSSCAFYGGQDSCGAAGTPVAMKDLQCTGGEVDIAECKWTSADEACADHSLDSLVYCSSGLSTQDGTLRLLASDGSASIDGAGRLEMFRSGGWAPVCTAGFTAGAAVVACKAMGFSSVPDAGDARRCVGEECGTMAPYISQVTCAGDEDGVLQCPFQEGDDVYCSSAESVFLSCGSSDGETQGRPVAAFAPQSLGAEGPQTR